MPPPELAPLLYSGLRAVRRRRMAADTLWSLALAAVMFAAGRALLVLLTAGPATASMFSLSAAALCGLASMRAARWRWSSAEAARLIERVAPASHNVIVTAEELLRTGRGSAPVVRRVVKDADSVLVGAPVTSAVPMARPIAACLTGFALAVLALVVTPRMSASPDRSSQRGDTLGAPVEAGDLAVTVSPPAYLDLPEQRLPNPARIDAVTGSRLRLVIGGSGGSRVRFGTKTLELQRTSSGSVAELVLTGSGYLAIEDAPAAAAPRFLPVVVTPDRAPTVTLEAPGKDLLLPSADAAIPLSGAAMDDFGLRLLELRFTKVSGSGEQFEFEEGRLPLAIDRGSKSTWRAAGTLALKQLKLQPGDSLVYRLVGADARPAGAGLSSSDTYFIEIAGPGQVTLAGFELPPDRERHALSQQMILLKLQRLQAKEPSMARDAIVAETASIAAEQRAVRANFIFLTGGHVEDEAEEAAHSHEIQEGRLEHSARREISDAIAHMSRVEQALGEVNTRGAIPPARAAVEALQRAFGRSRYLLRSLPVRSRLDPSRRLSGDLADVSDSSRVAPDPEVTPEVAAAREILGQLLPVVASRDRAAADGTAARLADLAERALAASPGSTAWQGIASALLDARRSLLPGASGTDSAERLREAIRVLQQEAGRGATAATPKDPGGRSLRGAWAESGGAR